MANACFRCKSSIPSGKTFCSSCRQQVSLDFSYTAESRLWIVIAAAPITSLLIVGGTATWASLTGRNAGLAAAASVAFAVPFVLAFAYALYRDFQHIQKRDDTDWNPSKWGYILLVFFSGALLFPMFVVAPYHLYRRKQTIGLPLRRTD